jgi:hypothetical protein
MLKREHLYTYVRVTVTRNRFKNIDMSIEKYLERKLREGVLQRKGWALKFHCLSFTGMPDRMVLLPGGRVFFVELKDRGVNPSPRQRVVHEWLDRNGFDVRVINTPELLGWFWREADAGREKEC